jgi:acylphosphatase
MNLKIEKVRIDVFGRVQGINFRFMVKKFADELGLRGYVLNKNDGSVEIVAQGIKMDIDKLMNWVKSSPGFSSVEGIKVNKISNAEKFKEFKIL